VSGARPRIDRLPAGDIHAVGVAGLETAAMVRYLVEGGRRKIVLHDSASDFDRALDLAHRFQPADQRVRVRAALARCSELRTGRDYLAGVESAAAVLIPVSWFLHPANARLAALRERFVTYPDACFDLWRGPVIGVSGSYGKTTTTRFAAALSGGVYCGNDRESLFDLGALATEPLGRLMAFEASNRHLHNSFRRVLDVGVLTGISLNHEPDHGSFAAYRQVKYSLADRCRDLIYHASIPASYPDAAVLAASGAAYGPGGVWRLTGVTVQGPGGCQYPVPGVAGLTATDRENALAATAAAACCGVLPDDLASRSRSLSAVLPLYRHATAEAAGRTFVNDAASCMPASTVALVAGLDRPFVLICGGDRQRYRTGEFDGLAMAVAGNPYAVSVHALGPMAGPITDALRSACFAAVDRCGSLAQAVERALQAPAEVVAFSPGCGTGTEFVDKYARGEAFDRAVAALVPASQATR
jgi:UDP-N-acetylmuramoylalanine-D-glutamate ligase